MNGRHNDVSHNTAELLREMSILLSRCGASAYMFIDELVGISTDIRSMYCPEKTAK